MPDKYYSPEDYDTLCSEIETAEEAIVHLLTIPLNDPYAKHRTPEMMKAFEELAEVCADYVTRYKFLVNAELFRCPDTDAQKKSEAINKVAKLLLLLDTTE